MEKQVMHNYLALRKEKQQYSTLIPTGIPLPDWLLPGPVSITIGILA